MNVDLDFALVELWRKWIKPLRKKTATLGEGNDLLAMHQDALHLCAGAIAGLLGAFGGWWLLCTGAWVLWVLWQELVIDYGYWEWTKDNTWDTVGKLLGVLLVLLGLL